MTRRILFALVLLLTPALALADSLAGTYRVDGRNPDGSSYAGTVVITGADDRLEFLWDTGTTFRGTGVREGRVVTVDWGDAYPVVYVVMPDGELHGTWADGYGLDRLSPR